MPTNAIPLPEPWDYCYEWDGPFGTRKFSTASYNGNRPDRSVPIYTADQMHAHAAAVSAADNAALRAEVAGLREDAQRYQWLRDKARSVDWTESINGWSWTQHCRIGARGMDAAIDAARKGTA